MPAYTHKLCVSDERNLLTSYIKHINNKSPLLHVSTKIGKSCRPVFENVRLEDKEGGGRITLSSILVSYVDVMGDKWGLFILPSFAVSDSSDNSTAGVVTGLIFDFKGNLN
jgi:hypothetical protein